MRLPPVILGTSVILSCTASGDLPITWQQVGQEQVVLNADPSSGELALEVTNTSQYGNYILHSYQ